MTRWILGGMHVCEGRTATGCRPVLLDVSEGGREYLLVLGINAGGEAETASLWPATVLLTACVLGGPIDAADVPQHLRDLAQSAALAADGRLATLPRLIGLAGGAAA